MKLTQREKILLVFVLPNKGKKKVKKNEKKT